MSQLFRMPANACPILRLGRLAALGIEYDAEDAVALSQHTWWLGQNGYVYTGGNGEQVSMHHFLVGKPERPLVVDHINNNTKDNRRKNLQHMTMSQNILKSIQPKRKLPRHVYEANGRYKACVTIAGRSKHIGTYDTVDAATEAVEQFKHQQHE